MLFFVVFDLQYRAAEQLNLLEQLILKRFWMAVSGVSAVKEISEVTAFEVSALAKLPEFNLS